MPDEREVPPCYTPQCVDTHHADEDVGGGVERLDGRRSHGESHEPGDLTDDELHEAPIVEDTDDGTEVDHDGKHLQVPAEPTITPLLARSTTCLPV